MRNVLATPILELPRISSELGTVTVKFWYAPDTPGWISGSNGPVYRTVPIWSGRGQAPSGHPMMPMASPSSVESIMWGWGTVSGFYVPVEVNYVQFKPPTFLMTWIVNGSFAMIWSPFPGEPIVRPWPKAVAKRAKDGRRYFILFCVTEPRFLGSEVESRKNFAALYANFFLLVQSTG